MHPTIHQILVTDHHRTLRADADHARLVSIARANARAATAAAPAAGPQAHRSIVRRLVARLAAA